MITRLVLIATLACPVPSIDQIDKLVGAGWDSIARTYWRTFDLDGDLKPDYHIEYDILGVNADKTFKISPFPIRYFVDKDHDGVYESIYIDMQGNGKCEDLRPYTGKERSYDPSTQ